MNDATMTDPAPARSGGLISPEMAILTVFFMQAFAGGGLFPRIPDLQTQLGISEGTLGLMLMGQPVGAFSAILFASYLIEKVGSRLILSICIPMIAVATVLTAVVPDWISGFLVMALYGLVFASANMSMNVEADRIEAMTGRRIMNRCHGVWSLGFLASSTLGAAARGVPLDPFWHFTLILPVVLAVAAVAIFPMQPAPPRPHAGNGKKRVIAWPTWATAALVGVIFAGVFCDATVRAWSVILMRDTFAAPDWVDALTLPAFLVTLTGGRMIGDRLVEEYGASRLSRALLLVAGLGAAMVLSGLDLWVAIAGFALIGAGVSVIFPLVMSAAARIGDRPASENVTAVSLMTNVLMLGTPGLIGLMAEFAGIRWAYAITVPVLVIAFLLAGRLDPPGEGDESRAV